MTVRPTMSLLESCITQEAQANICMKENHLNACNMSSGRSFTCNCVSKLCEDELMKQQYQINFYACYVDGPSRLRIKRLPNSPIYCERCEDLDDLCPTHCRSPITTFHRIRTIVFIEQCNGNFEMNCSCLYHPTYGIPCRHQARVLNAILPSHVIARHHTTFHANYKKPGMEATTEEFDMMPLGFWQELDHYQICENGVISETAHSDEEIVDETFLGGAFSQDVSLSQEPSSAITVEDSVASIQRLASMQMVYQNSNLYDSTISQVKRVINTCQTCNDPELESFWTTGLSELIGQFQEQVVKNLDASAILQGNASPCQSLWIVGSRRETTDSVLNKHCLKRCTQQQLQRTGKSDANDFEMIKCKLALVPDEHCLSCLSCLLTRC